MSDHRQRRVPLTRHEERRRATRLSAVLAAAACAAGLLGGCAALSNITGAVTGESARVEQRKQQELRLQQKVMRYADGYADSIAAIATTLELSERDPAMLPSISGFGVDQALSAVQIAAGPSARINALDMVVLSTLTRASLERYLQARQGAEVTSALATLSWLESEAWEAVNFLTEEQHRELRDALARRHADRTLTLDSVTFARFTDFVDDPEERRTGSGTASLFALVGLDPLAGLSPAVREIEQTRMLAERGLYYAERVPMLMGMQVKSLATALLRMPEPKEMIAAADRASRAAESLSHTAAIVPETLSREREAAIKQVFDAMRADQAMASELLAGLKATFDSAKLTSDSLTTTVKSMDQVMARFDTGKGDRGGGPPSRPFDITEYAAAAVQFAQAARELQQLAGSIERGAPALATLAAGLGVQGQQHVDHVYRRLLQLIGFALLGSMAAIVATRLILVRVAARRGQPR